MPLGVHINYRVGIITSSQIVEGKQSSHTRDRLAREAAR